MESTTRKCLISKKRTKKSQGIISIFFFIILLLAFSLFFIVINKTWSEVKDPLDTGLNSALPSDSPVNVSNTLSQTTSTNQLYDKLIPFLIIGLLAFVMISAGFIFDHPIMIFVGVIILGVVILIAVVYSNIYNNITETTEFASTKSDLAITDKIMKYLPYIAFVVIIGVGIMMAMNRKGGGSPGL